MSEQPIEEPPTWLEPPQVAALLGDALMSEVDPTALDAWIDAARSFVEERRSDLLVVDEVTGVGVFVATPSVVAGASLLAYRWYKRRTVPLGVLGATEDGAVGILREDPDIARLLGIGRQGRFVVGGTRRAVS